VLTENAVEIPRLSSLQQVVLAELKKKEGHGIYAALRQR
jgi:hypothetical protein